MFNCKICKNFKSKTRHGLSQHIRLTHKISASDYKVNYEGKIIFCVNCGKPKKHNSTYNYCFKCYQLSNERKKVSLKIVSNRRSFNGEKNPNYKGLILKKCLCGKEFKVTPALKNTAKYCSANCKYRFCSSATKVTIYKEIRFKSRWEAAFAKWCDQQNLTWDYEKIQIRVNDKWYIPDFFIKEWNCFAEVKGFWRTDAKEKFNLASKNHKIKLIDKNWFLANGFQCKPKEGIFISSPGDFI